MLDTIVQQKKREIEEIPKQMRIEEAFVKRSLYEAIANPNYPVGIIAEVKKASPSKGVLTKDFNPLNIAETYEKLSVDGISVLTDEQFFQGHPRYLTEIKQKVNVPILRKDFIIDEKQIIQSKALGADAILLIAAILDGSQLKELYEQAESLNLDVLVEVHNEREVDNVLSAIKPKLIGVNNRNLKTFETSLETSRHLAAMLPKDILFISESGVKTKEDVDYLRKTTHVNGLLVGEAFMLEKNKGDLLRGWFEERHNHEYTS
ncbi:indole-3-glycerol phosphate synthase TrpC [Bacillus tamaricis]|uniref:Indole-3-glycerol phosphate synthase n=1 Tax=Evansella tamaricis TaxID=2069301 RepID=A0ABS6JHJ8_9BACI|nr:indole-3-glycerol phosphate synthase TrpC [Evansella tamaricis]